LKVIDPMCAQSPQYMALDPHNMALYRNCARSAEYGA